MRILLDARKLGDGGIGTYIECLIDGIFELVRDQEAQIGLSLIVTSRWHSLLQDPNHRWAGNFNLIVDDTARYSIGEYCRLARKLKDVFAAHDCFHSPHYTLPFGISIPKVVTIHDTIHVSHPETKWHRRIGGRLICSAIKRADRIITVSQCSAQALRALCDRAPEKTRVVHNAVSNIFRERSSSVQVSLGNEGAGYMLFVGNDRPHKGFYQLVEAWRDFNLRRERKGLKPYLLVAVGDSFSQGAKQWVTEHALDEQIHFFGPASDDELASLYERASGLLMPSRIEGFGLPALEALWFGCPVVCRAIDALREVCGDCAWYAEGDRAEEFVEALLAMTSDEELRGRRVRDGIERAAQATPKALARNTIAVYREAMGWEPLDIASGPSSQTPELLRAQGGR